MTVPLELSNSAGKFWDVLTDQYKLTPQNYKQFPEKVAEAIFIIVNGWHKNAAIQMKVEVDLEESFYLVLLWNLKGYYQLFQFPITLPDPNQLSWHFPSHERSLLRRHLRGEDAHGKLFEWYGESGGQLKYYPRLEQAVWKSEPFQLEPLPANTPDRILSKVRSYFPDQWASTELLAKKR